ncbi:MAG: trigger factor [Clostridia bacterium]|nr:trigger factor [Clostridia bacterium]
MKLRSSNKIETNRWELEIEIEPEVFSKEVDKVYNRQKGKITIPGFRKGKAPRAFIEKFYGEGVFYEDAINALYPQALEDAAKEAGIEVVDDKMDIETVKLSKEDGFIFKVKLTVMPEVSVENYKGIEIKKVKTEKVTDKDVDAEIEKARNKAARLVNCEDGKAEMGDVTNIDFEGSVDGEKFEGGTADDVTLELGSGQFIPGFEEQIAGHKIGDNFEVKVTFPESYHVPALAGKEAVFKTKLNKIQKKELPEVNDEFVKDISEFDTLDEYKKDLKEKLEHGKKHVAEDKAENEMIEKFIELVKAEIPDALIKNKTKDLVRDFEYRLQPQGITLKDYIKYTGITEEKLNEQFRPQAEKHVKLELGLKKVAELEKVEVKDEEIEEEYKKIAEGYRLKPEQVKNFVRKEDITTDIKKRKVLEIIRNSRVEK